MSPCKFLTSKEVAVRLSISIAALQKRRARHQPPDFYKFGKSVRYAVEDIEAFETLSKQDTHNEE